MFEMIYKYAIRKFLTADRRAPAIGPKTLTVLIGNELVAELNDDSENIVLLDEKRITAELIRLSETDKYFSRRNVVSFVEYVAKRVAHRMSPSLSIEWGLPKGLIVEAIYFHLWIELCTIIPLRRLARVIAGRAAGKTVLVSLSSLNLQCLKLGGSGGSNELEPLILYWALQRLGCRAYLLARDAINSPELSIRIRPWPFTLPPAYSRLQDECLKGRPIIAPDGLRGLDVLLEEVEGASFLMGPHLMESHDLESFPFVAGIGSSSQLECCIDLRKDSKHDFWPLISYSAEWPTDPFKFYFCGILGPAFRSTVARARSLVAKAAIKEAYVCDHLFMGSSILAHSVKQQGGFVTLWPHSANPSHVGIRDEDYFDNVVVVTKAASQSWKRKFPNKTVKLRPRIMLPPQRKPRTFNPAEPLTVVVFGGDHFVGRLPFFHVEKHIQCYKRFFSLGETAKFARLKYKPKAGNENVTWFANNVTKQPETVDIVTNRATSLDYPNMIFITIGHGSSALLEGIASAVPCMIVREQEIEDYTCLDSKVVPTGSVEFIWTMIEKCRCKSFYDVLLMDQVKWLAHQAFDSDVLG
jgi:hypothetical protein